MKNGTFPVDIGDVLVGKVLHDQRVNPILSPNMALYPHYLPIVVG
jgi:hypothetical protein